MTGKLDIDANGFRDVCEQLDLTLAVLFGSTARGRAIERSDIDIGVVSRRSEIDLMYRDEVKAAIVAFFRPKNVDVVFLNNADPFLQFSVAREGQCLYEQRAGQFARYQLYALKMHEDTGKLLRWYREYAARVSEKLRG